MAPLRIVPLPLVLLLVALGALAEQSARQHDDRMQYVAVFRGERFEPSPLSVLINGIDAPHVLFHNDTVISFVIPASVVDDTSVFDSSFVDITVGNVYHKLPLTALRTAVIKVDYDEYRRQVLANSQPPSQPQLSPEPEQLTDQLPPQSPRQPPTYHLSDQLQTQPSHAHLRHHFNALQDPFSPADQLTSAYSAVLHYIQQSNSSTAIHAIAVATLSNIPHSPLSRSEAVHLLRQAADNGNPHAHAELAFLYATGIAEPFVPRYEPAALLHWTIAAEAGSLYASMALAHRYHVALSVSEDCPRASDLYRTVANVTAPSNNPLRILLPSFLTPPPRRRLREGRPPQPSEEVVQYIERAASRGDPGAQVELAKLMYFEPSSAQDIRRATMLFQSAAESGRPDAHALLGFIHLSAGNNSTAIRHFFEAANKKERNALNALGFVHLHGIGLPKNATSAASFFRKASEKDHPDAFYSLADMYEQGIGVRKSPMEAFTCLMHAAALDHVQAAYKLGLRYLAGKAPVKYDCAEAVTNLKKVAESGVWQPYLDTAGRLHEKGKYAQALYRYLKAAHAGLELGQYNSGFMYEKGTVSDRGSSDSKPPREELVHSAIEMYSMSAAQGDVLSMIRVGDLAFAELRDYARAAGAYEKASRAGSAEAHFNLGWMHARGLGMNADKHIAKRYFDHAKSHDPDAWLPSTIAVFGLRHYGIVFGGLELMSRLYEEYSRYISDIVIVTILLGVLVVVVNARQRRLIRYDRDEGIEEEDQTPGEVPVEGNNGTEAVRDGE